MLKKLDFFHIFLSFSGLFLVQNWEVCILSDVLLIR
jgi:hypothetical protein